MKCGANLSNCNDTTNFSVFGIPTKQKEFGEDGLVFTYRTYSKYFGITQVITIEGTSSTQDLVGCRINGVTYGDTLLTGVESVSSEVPESYSLGQNYPNPFNPRTVVSFSLPVVSNVTLKIYDVQGREVRTLVNERMQAGRYEVDFDASGMNSGVYFYQMTVHHGGSSTGNFTETRRMMLLK